MATPRTVLPLLVLALTAACRSGDAPAEEGAVPPPPAPAGEVRSFGAPLAPGEVLPLTRVLAAADAFAEQTVTVEGLVRRNCTAKGCWMELAAGDDKALQGCRVTFQDYGFFVPLDSAGSRARVQGRVTTKVVGSREVEHLEGEGATFPSKQPDGTAREVRIVATGVELTRS
jgi:hypothetical protein